MESKNNSIVSTKSIQHRTHLSLHNSHYPTLNTQNGITLVALVITIIVLLILAGVTIMSLLSEDGIFERAERAAYETRKARFEERIGLVNLEAQTQKALNGSLTVEDYFEIVKDHGLISDSTIGGDNIEDKGEDEEGKHVYEVTTEEGDVFEVTIDDEGNVETEYQGQADGLPPRITGIETSKTTNSITVKVMVNRLEGGEISYYIKKASEEEYPDEAEETSKDTSYTFEGLEQNVTYDIKVVVENSKGRDEKETSEITGELTTGAITQKGETVWSNGQASIELETTETEYTIQYKVGENGQWQEYKGAITGLHHNDKVYVRLWDGINGSGETAITITDGIKPTVNVTTGTQTTSSIQVSVSSSDDQSGMPASPTYSYYIKLASQGDYSDTPTYTTTDASYTFSGLRQNTTYDIKVEVTDNAGNVGEGSTSGETTGVGGAEEGLQQGNITVGETTWANNKASITLSTSTNFMIQYKVGSSGTWTPASYLSSSAGADVTVTNLSHNDRVYARLMDNAGNLGSEASVTIQDGIAPTVNSLTVTGYDTTSISVSASATDNQSGIYSYQFQYKLSTASSYTTAKTTVTSNTTCTYKYTGLSDDTTYDLRVIATDNAGLTNNKTATQKTVDANVGPVIASAAFNSKTTNSIKVTARATDENGDTLTYRLYTSTSENGTYTQKASTSASQNSTVTLNATGLSQYTTYWWYVQVSDGEETITSSKQSERTNCPGTGYTCYTKSCSGTRTTTCTTCNGNKVISKTCSDGIACTVCGGTGKKCNGIPVETGSYNWICSYGHNCTTTEYYCNTCGEELYLHEDPCVIQSGTWLMHRHEKCTTCGGSGGTPCIHGYTSQHSYNETCSKCNGNGMISTSPCTHGYSASHRYCDHYTNTSVASHSYCSHNRTSQHD